jgi:hypothetical protein
MREPYEPPSRQRIAERVTGHLPGTGNHEDDLSDVITRREPPGDPLANFAVHLKARMRALGWDQAQLQERAEVSAHVAAKAVNGTGCDLALAGKIAALVGSGLTAMIGPYRCQTCEGKPPAGFRCMECDKEGPRG